MHPNEDGPIFSKIDRDIKDRAQRYVVESKIAGIETSSSLKSLIEASLTEYMDNHQLVK